MSQFEKFSGKFSSVISSLLLQLDRNFAKVPDEFVVMTVTKSLVLTPDDSIGSVQVDATAVAVVITLPSQPNGNRRRTVIKTDTSVNTVTISGNGHNINGATTYVLAAQYDRVTLEPTGSSWLIIT